MGTILDWLIALGGITELRIVLYASIAIFSMGEAVRRPRRVYFYYAVTAVFATFIFLALALALEERAAQSVLRGIQSVNLTLLLAAMAYYAWRDYGKWRGR